MNQGRYYCWHIADDDFNSFEEAIDEVYHHIHKTEQEVVETKYSVVTSLSILFCALVIYKDKDFKEKE